MIRHGVAPYLECSSKGDKRFSAMYARIARRGGKTIEEIYQAAKEFTDGTGFSVKKAKGRKPLNEAYCRTLYARLWDEYIDEKPELLEVIRNASGLSDIFGQEGHCCQATELWRIRTDSYMDELAHLGQVLGLD